MAKQQRLLLGLLSFTYLLKYNVEHMEIKIVHYRRSAFSGLALESIETEQSLSRDPESLKSNAANVGTKSIPRRKAKFSDLKKIFTDRNFKLLFKTFIHYLHLHLQLDFWHCLRPCRVRPVLSGKSHRKNSLLGNHHQRSPGNGKSSSQHFRADQQPTRHAKTAKPWKNFCTVVIFLSDFPLPVRSQWRHSTCCWRKETADGSTALLMGGLEIQTHVPRQVNISTVAVAASSQPVSTNKSSLTESCVFPISFRISSHSIREGERLHESSVRSSVRSVHVLRWR